MRSARRVGRLVAPVFIAMTGAPATGGEGEWSLDFSGELRERYESARNPVFGLPESSRNDYLLHRALLSVGLRGGDDWSALLEVASGLTSGWSGPRAPSQDDPLDILRAYVEKSLDFADGDLEVRIGRQDLVLGAARLVSIREATNMRRVHDGIRASWSAPDDHRLTAFLLRPVIPESGVFDDRSSSRYRFWGLHVTWPFDGREAAGIDTYYLGIDRAGAEFAQGKARERRHTAGWRAFGERAGWDWNVEAAWQWGSFGDARIEAWTVSLDAGFEWVDVPLSPRLGLKADAISGDRDPDDGRLGTFNALFPKLPYFSEATLATPANLLDLQPNLRLQLAQRLQTTIGWDWLRKHEAADAFYAPLLSPVAGTALTTGRDVGWQASLTVEFQPSERLELVATWVAFEPGSDLRQVGGRTGHFVAAWVRHAL